MDDEEKDEKKVKAGRARMAKLSPVQRAENARKAAEKRWAKPVEADGPKTPTAQWRGTSSGGRFHRKCRQRRPGQIHRGFGLKAIHKQRVDPGRITGVFDSRNPVSGSRHDDRAF